MWIHCSFPASVSQKLLAFQNSGAWWKDPVGLRGRADGSRWRVGLRVVLSDAVCPLDSQTSHGAPLQAEHLGQGNEGGAHPVTHGRVLHSCFPSPKP